MNIILLGDIAPTGIISTEPEKNEERFKAVVPLLNSGNMVFANLEVPLKFDNSRNEYKNFIHYSLTQPTKDLLQMLNIGCVSLANNHIFDCKMPGLQATISMLDELGIYHTGAGWLPEHIAPVEIHEQGKKIAFLAYVDKSTNPKSDHFPELMINYFDVNVIKNDIHHIIHRVDKILVSIHWGIDYSFYPTLEQIRISRHLINAGVDVIMGHHPHTIQPYEEYDTGLIFYSLGSLTFGDYIKEGKREVRALFRKTKKGVITELNIDKLTINFTPTHELKENFIRIIPRDFRKWSNRKWFLHKIKYSSHIMTILFNFKENVLDRIYEYFFGYYKNPIRRALQFSNGKKIQRLFREL